MNDIVKREAGTALAAPSTGNFLDIIRQIAMDPNVDVQKMRDLMDMQTQMITRQAEMNFNNALMDLSLELPRIKKDGKIVHKDKQTGRDQVIAGYAKYETIDAVIRPLLQKHGFALRFNTRATETKVIVTGTLSHIDGHSITDEIPLTIDASGAKNNVQGVGSTISYGQRYLVKMLLNLVFEGEDDDGAGGDASMPINDDMAAAIKDELRRTATDTRRFLQIMTNEAETVEQIPLKDYDRVIAALRAKKDASL